jgi:hypothetical protein
MKKAIDTGSRRNIRSPREKVKEEEHQGIFGQVEEFTHRGCYLER